MESYSCCVIRVKVMRMPVIFLLACMLNACQGPQPQQQPETRFATGHPIPMSVGAIPLPTGYQRIAASTDPYTSFLRKVALKEDRTVYLFNGKKKANQLAQYAVIDMDAGTTDLQQCADAVMRIRAEYLFQQKAYHDIAFTFTSGFVCDYEHYAAGYRLQTKGNSCSWVKRSAPDKSYAAFRRYLDVVYAYAGTRSMHAQLKPLDLSKMHPGAVFIQTGDPYGHAVTVMDMAVNPKTKDTIFLLSQSYMPAQDIHILVNPGDDQLSPWYTPGKGAVLSTPEWTFQWTDLREF